MDVSPYIVNIPAEFNDFAREIQRDGPVEVHSVTVVGSVLTPDFLADRSDINSIVVVEEVKVDFLDFMISLGKKYAPQRIAAPMLMTPEYIDTSLDVFPIEFFNYREIHHIAQGSDLLSDLDIDRRDLRLQCEREMKSKLLWLHQGYISSLGNEELLVRQLNRSITDYLHLFRSILHLAGRSLSLSAHDTVQAVEQLLELDQRIFSRVLEMKKNGQDGTEQLCHCFASYYQATHRLSAYVESLAP